MKNRHDKQYLSNISDSREVQISHEKRDNSNQLSISKNAYNTCHSWSKKYNEAYDKWMKLPEEKEEDWKRKILY
jgi:hypothetical protein